ncbi:unnamed protein product [Aphanomyces euteiches]
MLNRTVELSGQDAKSIVIPDTTTLISRGDQTQDKTKTMPSVPQTNKRGRNRTVSVGAAPWRDSICAEFADTGGCKFGYRCKQMHILHADKYEGLRKSEVIPCNQEVENQSSNIQPTFPTRQIHPPRTHANDSQWNNEPNQTSRSSQVKIPHRLKLRQRSKSHGECPSDNTSDSNDKTVPFAKATFPRETVVNNQKPTHSFPEQNQDLLLPEAWCPSALPIDCDLHRWFTHELEDYIERNDARLTSVRDKQRKAVNAIHRVVSELWNDARLEVYGSTYTQLCLPNSDVDCVILLPYPEKPPIDILHELKTKVEGSTWAHHVELLSSARIPVLKLQYVKGRFRVMLDITCGHSLGHSGIQARELVELYKYNMPAMRPLVIILKAHLHSKGLNASYSGGLSSYALVLLVIRFLQFYGDIHTAFLDIHEPEPQCDTQSCFIYTFFRNGVVVWQGTIGMLLVDFLEHHIYFDFHRYGISITNGGEYFDLGVDCTTSPMVCIMDPVRYNHNIGNSFRIHEIVHAWRVWHDQIMQRAPLSEMLT